MCSLRSPVRFFARADGVLERDEVEELELKVSFFSFFSFFFFFLNALLSSLILLSTAMIARVSIRLTNCLGLTASSLSMAVAVAAVMEVDLSLLINASMRLIATSVF